MKEIISDYPNIIFNDTPIYVSWVCCFSIFIIQFFIFHDLFFRRLLEWMR